MSEFEVPASPVISFMFWSRESKDSMLPNPANPVELQKPNAPAGGESPATQVIPRPELLLPGEPIAVDIEFEEYYIISDYKKTGAKNWKHRVAWFGSTNTRLEVVLDSFISYDDDSDVVRRLPRAKGKSFGVTWNRLKKRNGAVPARTLEQWCVKLFTGRVVVLHCGAGDKSAFMYERPFAGVSTHDTQDDYLGHKGKRQWGLAALAEDLLGLDIQRGGNHSPVEDAATTMKIYLIRNPYDRTTEAAKWKANFREVNAQSAAHSSSTIGVIAAGGRGPSTRGGNVSNTRGTGDANGKPVMEDRPAGASGNDTPEASQSTRAFVNNIQAGPDHGNTQINVNNMQAGPDRSNTQINIINGSANITGPSRGGVQHNYFNAFPALDGTTGTRGGRGGRGGRRDKGPRQSDTRGGGNSA